MISKKEMINKAVRACNYSLELGSNIVLLCLCIGDLMLEGGDLGLHIGLSLRASISSNLQITRSANDKLTILLASSLSVSAAGLSPLAAPDAGSPSFS